MKILQAEQFLSMFDQCAESAFHLEVRDSYAVSDESEPLRRFLSNEPDDYEWFEDWLALVRRCTERGAAMTRVRVVTEPHSDYHRWLLELTKLNTQAGEDIRYLPRHLVNGSQVPLDDWWLLDDRRIVFNLTDKNGQPAGGAISTDPQLVEHCRHVKHGLWPLAIPYAEYVGKTTERITRP